MFCAICECGPAAGPKGVSREWPNAVVRNESFAGGHEKVLAGDAKNGIVEIQLRKYPLDQLL